jgi:tellurite methyltransferase
MTRPTDDKSIWPAYYERLEGRAPRDLFLRLLGSVDQNAAPQAQPRLAIDLGCGDGTESAVLLQRGWRVLAIDSEREAIRRLEQKVTAEQRSRLETRIADFEEVALPKADLIYAGLSLPFCTPTAFPTLWQKIVAALHGGRGRFAGQLFGERDDWAGDPRMTFLSADAARGLLNGLEIEHFEEFDGERGTAMQGMKRTHAFEIIVRKPT